MVCISFTELYTLYLTCLLFLKITLELRIVWVGSEIKRQKDVPPQLFWGPATEQFCSTLRSFSRSPRRAGTQLLPLPCQLRPGNVGKGGETHWMERLAPAAAGSLLPATLLAPGGVCKAPGFRVDSFPEDSGWGCALLNRARRGGDGRMWRVRSKGDRTGAFEIYSMLWSLL